MSSRKNRQGTRRPQHNRLAANQELRRAVQAGKPEPFGIRRWVSYQDDIGIRDRFYDLLIDDDNLAELVHPRTKLQLTIMRKRQLDSQLARGLIVGYEYGKAQAQVKSQIQQTLAEGLEVQFVEPRVIKHGRALVMAVDSEDLRQEVRNTMKAMASIGLKGALRSDGFSPHITLGESDHPMTRLEKSRVIDATSEVLEKGATISLGSLDFYPKTAQTDVL